MQKDLYRKDKSPLPDLPEIPGYFLHLRATPEEEAPQIPLEKEVIGEEATALLLHAFPRFLHSFAALPSDHGYSFSEISVCSEKAPTDSNLHSMTASSKYNIDSSPDEDDN